MEFFFYEFQKKKFLHCIFFFVLKCSGKYIKFCWPPDHFRGEGGGGGLHILNWEKAKNSSPRKIPHLSCKFEHFKKNYVSKDAHKKLLTGGLHPPPGLRPCTTHCLGVGTFIGTIDKRRYKIRLYFVYISVWNFNVYGPCVWVVHPRWFACRQTFYFLWCVEPVLMIDKST